jgi:hypothetical protein
VEVAHPFPVGPVLDPGGPGPIRAKLTAPAISSVSGNARAPAQGGNDRRFASRGDERLDHRHIRGLESEIEDVEIFAHMRGVGGPGKGQYADIEGEPENDLADGPTVAFGHSNHFVVCRHVAVGRQQRETLIDRPVSGTELADAAIPTPGGVTSVLNEAGPNPRVGAKAPELFEGHVADAEKAHPAARVNRFHGAPGRPVVGTKPRPARRAVKYVGIDDVGPQMLERAPERLRNLIRYGGVGVIGQAMILPTAVCELGLKEQIIPRHQTPFHRVCDAPPDASFVIMLALIRGIDTAKSLFKGDAVKRVVSSAFQAVP